MGQELLKFLAPLVIRILGYVASGLPRAGACFGKVTYLDNAALVVLTRFRFATSAAVALATGNRRRGRFYLANFLLLCPAEP